MIKKVGSAYSGWSSYVGWSDPKGLEITPRDLIGYPYNPGVYSRMRYSHPVIASIMDSRKNFLKSLSFEFSGEYADILNDFWNNQVKTDRGLPYDLSAFIAETSDSKSSFGFSLYEYHLDRLAIYLYPINPVQVVRFYADDTDNTLLKSVEIQASGRQTKISADEVQLFINSDYPGNFWGMSDLRPLLTDFLIWENEAKNFLSIRPLEKGIVYAAQEDVSNDESTEEVLELLQAYLNGQTVAAVLDPGYRLYTLQVNNGQDSVAQYQALSENFANLVRSVLYNNLDSLGISTHGSRALAETLVVSDDTKLEQYIEAQLEELKQSTLFADIARELEIPVDAIEITATGMTSSDDRLNYDRVWELIQSGVLNRSDIGTENWNNLLEGLGLKAPQSPSVAPEASTLMEGSPNSSESNTEPSGAPQDSVMSETYMAEVPQSVIDAYKKGIEKHKQGLSGNGLKPETVRVANSIIESGTVTEDWIKEANAWWARNGSWINNPEDSAAYVAALLWGGAAGRDFYEREAKKLEG